MVSPIRWAFFYPPKNLGVLPCPPVPCLRCPATVHPYQLAKSGSSASVSSQTPGLPNCGNLTSRGRWKNSGADLDWLVFFHIGFLRFFRISQLNSVSYLRIDPDFLWLVFWKNDYRMSEELHPPSIRVRTYMANEKLDLMHFVLPQLIDIDCRQV